MSDQLRGFAIQHLESHGIHNVVDVDEAVHQLLEAYIPNQTARGRSTQALWDVWSRQQHTPVAADLPPLIMSTIWDKIARSAKAEVQKHSPGERFTIDTNFVTPILETLDLDISTRLLARLQTRVDERETQEQIEKSRQEAEKNAIRIIQGFNSNWRVVLDYEVSRKPPDTPMSTWVGTYLNTYLFPGVDLPAAITVDMSIINAVKTLNTWSTSNDDERNQVAEWLVTYVRDNILIKDADDDDRVLFELINLALSSHMTLAQVEDFVPMLVNVTFSFRPTGTVDDDFKQELSNLVKFLL
jgi:hypothetical protein